MAVLKESNIKDIIAEVVGEAENTRRAFMHRRHKIYLDGGKQYLIEQLKREFSEDAVREMRLCPVNLLKKIINKISSVYKEAPIRLCSNPKDQELVDYYTKKNSINLLMSKGNRYYNLFSNNILYVTPKADGTLKTIAVPSYLYSVIANKSDPTQIDGYILSDFIEEGNYLNYFDVSAPTGNQGFSRARMRKELNDSVASGESAPHDDREFIMWDNDSHFTTNNKGEVLGAVNDELINPIGVVPMVNIAKDRDNSPWAEQGDDLVDLSIAVQLAFSDILSIAKHQGFSLLSIISEEEPKNLKIGLNRAVWLKSNAEGPQPSIQYVQAQSPLDSYKGIILDLIALMLSTNDLSVNSISGSAQSKNVTSGFQALIEMSDTLEVIEQQKPVMKKAEHDLWNIISKWHNVMYMNNILDEEAKSLGMFSDDFKVEVNYRDIKPIESEQEKVSLVKELIDLKLITKKDAIKKLNPDLMEEQIDEKMKELESEYSAEDAQLMDELTKMTSMNPKTTNEKIDVMEEKDGEVRG